MSQKKNITIGEVMSVDNSSLASRIKWYESRYTSDVFMPMAPIVARLDGRSFSNFTNGLQRPYDERLSRMMIETAKYLVAETNARCGYTQSDEISLVWLAEDWDTKVFFAGKVQKMNSVLAATASAVFNRMLPKSLPEKAEKLPVFDCRVFQVPTEIEAVNCFIWREQDATRNSVQMSARSVYSHKECHKKNVSQLQEMLFQKGINWNDYPTFFKRGTYVRRRVLERPYLPEELDALPEKHAARTNANLCVKRTVVMEENEFPILSRIANREEVILHGADPVELAKL